MQKSIFRRHDRSGLRGAMLALSLTGLVFPSMAGTAANVGDVYANAKMAAGSFKPGPKLKTGGYYADACVRDGKILLARTNQDHTDHIERYDPITNTFELCPPHTNEYKRRSKYFLSDGKVLSAGAHGSSDNWLRCGFVYDPATGGIISTGNTIGKKAHYKADAGILLNNGELLLWGEDSKLWVEIYNPATGQFRKTKNVLSENRRSEYHASALLGNGQVLVTGGQGNNYEKAITSAEIFNPETESFSMTGPMTVARAYHRITPLLDGRVLVTGGNDANGKYMADAEIYDSLKGTFSPIGKMNQPRGGHSATLLSNGKVLIAGGISDGFGTNSAELFDPTTNTFTPIASLTTARYAQRAVLMPSGKVLLAGGYENPAGIEVELSSTEIYDPEEGGKGVPQILNQPKNLTVQPGEKANFRVEAEVFIRIASKRL